MKKYILKLLKSILILLVVFTGHSTAADYVYRPYYTGGLDSFLTDNYNKDDYDLENFDHNTAYVWGIDLNLVDLNGNAPGNQKFNGFRLYFENIRNWQIEQQVFFVSLLNGNPPETMAMGIRVESFNSDDGVNIASYCYNGKSGFQSNNLSTIPRHFEINIMDYTYDCGLN